MTVPTIQFRAQTAQLHVTLSRHTAISINVSQWPWEEGSFLSLTTVNIINISPLCQLWQFQKRWQAQRHCVRDHKINRRSINVSHSSVSPIFLPDPHSSQQEQTAEMANMLARHHPQVEVTCCLGRGLANMQISVAGRN